MNKIIIETDKAPKAVGAYSQGVMANGILFISGQVPLDPDTGKMVEGSIGDKTRRAMDNIGGILEAGGMSWDNLVKVTILLKDIKDFAEVNKVYQNYFTKDFPARACYQAGNLPVNASIEIEAIAMK
ncbi:MAG: RidA family protein [Anaerovoracaceae bacterium]|jgi:2-iminobutanoate/2-iminopropanoate deaminase